MLENVSYCPVLHARVAEIKALSQLSTISKDPLFPIFVWRPWPNAKSLSMTWDKIHEGFGDRRFGLDLDRSKFHSLSDKVAAQEFDELFDSQNGHEKYYAFVKAIPSAIPVLRTVGGAAHDLADQIPHILELNRGVIVRLEFGLAAEPFAVAQALLLQTPDVTILIDAGWSNDLLGRQAWASKIVSQIADFAPDTEIIVCGSSFPNSFTQIGKRGENLVAERSLFSNLARLHNAAVLVYGDWGSTRLPSDPKPMKNVPRIDLPTRTEWICFRSADDEDYADIADRMIADKDWPEDLSIWGTYSISCTALGLPGAIRSPGTAAAVRINIHLHRQAHFGATGEVIDGEEPYSDD